MSSKQVFGGAVAVILLGLYSWLVTYAILATLGVYGTPDDFTAEMATAMTTIGGLVSAFVVAELAVTVPGHPPAARLFISAGPSGSTSGGSPSGSSTPSPMAARLVSSIYLLIWIAAGLGAFVVGYLLKHDESAKELAALGQSWFGIAVAAGYAYMGIEPAKR